MNDALDKRVRQFIDGELDEVESRRALHAIADDAEARSLLRFEFRLRRHFEPSEGEAPVPEGFTDRVMESIEALEAPHAERQPSWYERLGDAVGRVIQGLVTPRPLVWRPVYGAAIVLLLVGLGFLGGRLTDPSVEAVPQVAGESVTQAAGVQQASSATSGEVLMRFRYVNSEASSVAVAGDFTNWEPVELEPQQVNGETVWTGIVPVSHGEHRYMFVIDGEKWVTDPLAPVQREDGFGNRNAVLAL